MLTGAVDVYKKMEEMSVAERNAAMMAMSTPLGGSARASRLGTGNSFGRGAGMGTGLGFQPLAGNIPPLAMGRGRASRRASVMPQLLEPLELKHGKRVAKITAGTLFGEASLSMGRRMARTATVIADGDKGVEQLIAAAAPKPSTHKTKGGDGSHSRDEITRADPSLTSLSRTLQLVLPVRR